MRHEKKPRDAFERTLEALEQALQKERNKPRPSPTRMEQLTKQRSDLLQEELAKALR